MLKDNVSPVESGVRPYSVRIVGDLHGQGAAFQDVGIADLLTREGADVRG
jgi:hypothetical protein